MMKKKIIGLGILLSAITILSFNVFADEEFSIRNDIQFGDTIDEVKEKETLDFQEDEEPDENGILKLTTVEGEIAGIDNSKVLYRFKENDDKEWELIEVGFSFPNYPTQKECDQIYNTLADAMDRKGGEKLDLNKDGKKYPFITIGFDAGIQATEIAAMFVPSGIDAYDEWIVKGDDYNVKIDLFKFHNGNDANYVSLAYGKFTDDEIESVDADL